MLDELLTMCNALIKLLFIQADKHYFEQMEDTLDIKMCLGSKIPLPHLSLRCVTHNIQNSASQLRRFHML